MKFSSLIAFTLGSALFADSLIIPEDAYSMSSAEDTLEPRDPTYIYIERRKGGGGGGHGGGGGGGHSSGGSHASGSSEGSSGGSSGSKGGSSSSGSSSSGSRGPTGPAPSYGGRGTYYGGGATSPYTSGLRSPGGLIAGGLLGAAAATALFHGSWYYPVYYYPYTAPITFYNSSLGANQTEPVQCLCEQYQECGCEDNTDPTYITSLLGNGSTTALNQTLVQVGVVNGTSTILINGTLPNGTSTGDNSSSSSSAPTSSSTPFPTSAGSKNISGKALGVVGWVIISGAIGFSMMVL